MAGFDEQELAVARLYAGAALGLAEKEGTAETLLEELAGLSDLLDRDPAIEQALASPLVEVEARRDLVEKTFRNRASDLLVNSLQVMNRKGRLNLVRAFIEGYRQEFERARGVTEVEVRSAEALTADELERARTVAEKWTGGSVRLVEVVDSEILAGLVFKAGDRKLNRSVARELDIMAAKLLERASQEVQGLEKA